MSVEFTVKRLLRIGSGHDPGSIDDISLTELKSFAGDDHYPGRWLKYLQGHSKHAGFNAWAAIFGLAWFVYRRLYRQGIVSIVLEMLIPAATGVAALFLLGASEKFVYGLLIPFSLIAVRVAFGFWANVALCNKAVREIREVDELNLDNDAHLQMIAAGGRVNVGAFVVAFGILGVIDRYLMLGL